MVRQGICRFVMEILAVPNGDNDGQLPAKRYRLGPVATYEVVADDFERIEQEATNVGSDTQFATFWIPISLSTFLTIISVPIADTKVYVTYLIVTLVGFGLGMFHAIRGWNQRGRLKRLMSRIRSNQVGPMGQEGKERGQAEIATLPAEAVPLRTEPQGVEGPKVTEL